MDQSPSGEFLDLQLAVAGRYSLEKEIGRGGMGIVFQARDVALDRLVAIKLLPPSMAKQSALRERFLREARTAAKLSHPNIIPIFSVEEIDRCVFFVMAYVEGVTLGQKVSASGPLSPTDATRVVREVAWALAYAHAQGVVHRDVKPENIMLEDGSGRALVTDFGIAQVAEAEAKMEVEVLGTPEFMSPEQAAGEPVDGRSDIYSLGATAYYVLAGRPPFVGESPSEILAHHIATPAPRLAATAPGIPRSLSGIIEQCLAKEPDDRIQSCELVAEALAGELQVRKQTPVAVRLFVKEAREYQERGLNLLYPAFGAWVGVPMIVLVPEPIFQLLGFGIVGASASAPVLSMIRRLRRVIRTGFRQFDLVQAFQEDLSFRTEELRHVYGDNYAKRHQTLRRIAYGALAVSVMSLLAMFPIGSTAPLSVTFLSALVAALAGWAADKSTDKPARRRLKFWKGGLAKWLFSVTSFGLEVTALPTGVTSRPTEIAIGMAVSSLFHSLPKSTRESMDDLPDVVNELETDAQRLRSQVDEFTQLLALAGDAEEGASRADEDSPAGQRYRAAQRIRAARDEAQRQFSETVAALENLRIDLLRMRAGTVNLESVTSNLGTARELSAQIDRLLQGHREIEDALKDSLG